MFITSSFLPQGNPCAVTPDQIEWHGWTTPIGQNGRFISAPPDISVGPQFPPGYSLAFPQVSQSWTSLKLSTGRWRVYVRWTGVSQFSTTGKESIISQITDYLTFDCLSLVDNQGASIGAVSIARENGIPQVSDGEYGGVDGCGHTYFQGYTPSAIRGADIFVANHNQKCSLNLKISSQYNLAQPLIDSLISPVNIHRLLCNYIAVNFFALDTCQCGQFLKSSLAFGY